MVETVTGTRSREPDRGLHRKKPTPGQEGANSQKAKSGLRLYFRIALICLPCYHDQAGESGHISLHRPLRHPVLLPLAPRHPNGRRQVIIRPKPFHPILPNTNNTFSHLWYPLDIRYELYTSASHLRSYLICGYGWLCISVL